MREMADPAHPPLIALLGPTGSGKSEQAAMLAARLGGEVVNCDAFQM
jgi:tRNA dimethylallyltransferase